MVPSTVVGLLVLAVAVLPGLMYTLAFERQAGAYGVTFADRTFRFIAVSAVYHLIAGWPEYGLYRFALSDRHAVLTAQFALLWVAGIVGVLAPLVCGRVLGRLYATRSSGTEWQQRLVHLVAGPDLAPRAWDDFFSERPTTYIRVLTLDGNLVGGLFASRSYAAGFPQEPDLLLEEAWRVNAETGELESALGYPLYIPAGQIRLMEIVRPEDDEQRGGTPGG